jgi:predicted ATP-grasp superfamily ATP-dependent carboligase
MRRKVNEIQRDLQKYVIVFSGFNQRAVIAFLRTLKENELKYAIIAKSEDDDIFLTEYKSNVLAVRRSVPLDLNDLLEAIKTVQNKCNMERCIIAPTSEALNRFLIAQKEHFNEIRCEIPLVDRDLYEAISDKYSFGELCSRNGICTPKVLEFDEINILPVVAKPKKYFSTVGKALSPIIIHNSQELKSFHQEQNSENYYFQEYISGKCLYLLYYFGKSGVIYKFSQENIVQQPDGKSMVAAVSSDLHNTIESKKYEELFKSLQFFGLVMVEVKQRDGINYMIEANPRFWGPSQLFVDAGVNFFEALLYDFEVLDHLPKLNESTDITRYFWFGGVVDTYKENKRLKFYEGNENDLMYSLPAWLQSDVYRRTDTMDIFKKEVFG